MMGDVNGLKLTNDIFGHAYGDLLLERIAMVFRSHCRTDDIVARWGGDEFILLLAKTSLDEARGIMGRIKASFANERVKSIKGSISMGIAVKEQRDVDVKTVLNQAEQAMYNAKTLEQDEVRKKTIGELIHTLHTNSGLESRRSERTSHGAQAIGRAMGLPEETIRKLKDAGYLHNIGKIILNPALYNGDHGLLEHGYEEFKRYPTVGYRILNSFDDTVDLAESVLAQSRKLGWVRIPQGAERQRNSVDRANHCRSPGL